MHRSRGAGQDAIVAGLVVGLTGCGQAPPGAEPVESRSEGLASPVACPDLRWVGTRAPGEPCPAEFDDSDGWQVSRLIADEAAPASLRKYCVYEWTGPGTPQPGTLPPKVAGDHVYPPAAWLDRDCMVGAAHADAFDVEAIVRPILTAAHAKQIETPAKLVPPPAGGGTQVLVAITDTWADAKVPPRSEHGSTVAAIVEADACSKLSLVPCPIQTKPFLALDRFGPNATMDEVHGGRYGTQSRLAQAIYQAVSAPFAGKRIINLSVGWEPEYNASTARPGQPSYPAEAVRETLEFAACSGVLVIAAAGNATGGPTPGSGPIYPAALEATNAPACTGVTRPLVYSVGAVDGYDEPIPNTRPGARPLLAAPGYAVPGTKTIAGSPVHGAAMTGTSVSTAVASAAAALVWHYDGTLAPHEVMELVRKSAVPLADAPDYCWAGSCTAIRRISICRALALVGANVTCNAVAIPAGGGTNPTYSQATLSALHPLFQSTADGNGLVSPVAHPQCSAPVLSLSPAPPLGPENLCPSELLESNLVLPSVDPQPDTDPCPDCLVELEPSGMTVELAINGRLAQGTLVTPETLTLTLGGQVVERYDLGSAVDPSTGATLRDGLAPGSTYRVELPPTSLAYRTGFDSMSIEWTRSDLFKTSHPIVVP